MIEYKMIMLLFCIVMFEMCSYRIGKKIVYTLKLMGKTADMSISSPYHDYSDVTYVPYNYNEKCAR